MHDSLQRNRKVIVCITGLIVATIALYFFIRLIPDKDKIDRSFGEECFLLTEQERKYILKSRGCLELKMPGSLAVLRVKTGTHSPKAVLFTDSSDTAASSQTQEGEKKLHALLVSASKYLPSTLIFSTTFSCFAPPQEGTPTAECTNTNTTTTNKRAQPSQQVVSFDKVLSLRFFNASQNGVQLVFSLCRFSSLHKLSFVQCSITDVSFLDTLKPRWFVALKIVHAAHLALLESRFLQECKLKNLCLIGLTNKNLSPKSSFLTSLLDNVSSTLELDWLLFNTVYTHHTEYTFKTEKKIHIASLFYENMEEGVEDLVGAGDSSECLWVISTCALKLSLTDTEHCSKDVFSIVQQWVKNSLLSIHVLVLHLYVSNPAVYKGHALALPKNKSVQKPPQVLIRQVEPNRGVVRVQSK
ncbi:hypothetical protein NECID01_1321 [Nematocida sp. AWRm77]|nr:hypothetical protein NECID01_1321 [Nematocida sp. AWRm77]